MAHILADTEEAAAFGHGYATAEDHGAELARLFLRARGKQASVFGEQFADEDLRVATLGIYDLAAQRFGDLPPLMQSILNAYAAGYNRVLEQRPSEFPAWAFPVSGVDVLAHARAVLLLDFAFDLRQFAEGPRRSAASNAWAIGRQRSESKRGMLLANPHVGWEGSTVFQEVQITVPGVINVSGGTFIGLPVVTIGFNEAVAWTHTANSVDADDLYELTLDGSKTHYQYNGKWLPLDVHTVAIEIRTKGGLQTRRERVVRSHYGPVRTIGGKAYAFKSANIADTDFLTQWNLMGKATSFQEFAAAIQMQQLPMFNVIYADRDGNIWYLFDGRIPVRPAGYNWSGAVPGNTSRTEWFALRPIDKLPQLFDPPTGYVQNNNDAPWYTNLEQPIDPAAFTDLDQADGLNWRSQTSLKILSHEQTVTLDELRADKFDSEFPFADRLKRELIPLVRKGGQDIGRAAADVLDAWDNRTEAQSRGAVLYVQWWQEYGKRVHTRLRTPWSPTDPIETPRGLSDPAQAVDAFLSAATSVKNEYGALDVPWGNTHRFRRGQLDLPLGGTPLTLRNVQYRRDGDGKLVAAGGDSYVLALEFTDSGPRAFTIVPYSASSNPKSPHFNDQAQLFASGQLKPAWFSERDIAANLEREYRPTR